VISHGADKEREFFHFASGLGSSKVSIISMLWLHRCASLKYPTEWLNFGNE
jgi:hypothetical protein